MPRVWAILPLLAAGCLPRAQDLHPARLWERVRTADTINLETGLIDRPAGDPYTRGELWAKAGRPLSHQLSTLHAQNGLRVGVVAGLIPGEFDRLLQSEQSMVAAMNRGFHPGAARVVPVNGPVERCEVAVLADLAQPPTTLSLAAVECGLNVTAHPVGTDRVRLVCEPQLQHGDKQAYLKPSADNATFTRQDRKPLETFPALAFEVTLGPADYLIVGPTEDPAGKLGQAFFVESAGTAVRQRVLVIRATRPDGNPAAKPVDPSRTAAGATAQQASR